MRTVLLWIISIPWTVFWGSLSVAGSFLDGSGDLGFRCMRRWARGLLWLGGIRLKVEGFEEIPKEGNYLFVSNHQSQADIITLAAGIPVKFGWMAKKSLFSIPFLGWHMKRMGYVAIDRSSVKSSTEGLFQAVKKLKDGGSLVIFPEGSRSVDGILKPFKDGAFYLAVESKVPLVPLTITGTRDIIRKGSYMINKGEVKVIASGIIKVDNLAHSDREKIKEEVRGKISARL